jgi:hypothetical protein
MSEVLLPGDDETQPTWPSLAAIVRAETPWNAVGGEMLGAMIMLRLMMSRRGRKLSQWAR